MKSSADVTVVIPYRRSNSYGHHVILAALEKEPPTGTCDVVLVNDHAKLGQTIGEKAKSSARVLVAWSFYSPDFPKMVEQLRASRSGSQTPKNVLHIAGGVHATAEPVATLQAGFDLVAVGEGEAAFAALINSLATETPAEAVPGIRTLDANDSLRIGKAAIRHELDYYPAFPWTRRLSNPIEITRGCVYACKFCQTPFMFKARFRHRSVANIRQHVRLLRDRGLTDIRFITPTSLSYGSQDRSVNLEAIECLLAGVRDELGDQGRIFFGSFPSEVRPEHIDKPVLRLLKRYVANDNIIIGGQSGSDSILAASNRGHDSESVIRAVRLCVEEQFEPNVDFIFGMPGETEDDVHASIELAEKLVKLGARIHGHTFMPLPGTPWRNELPGTVSPELLRELGRLTSQGKLYGQWQKQQETAAQLASSRPSTS